MRLCQLVSSYEQSSSPYADIDPAPDALRFLPEHEGTTVPLHKTTAVTTVDALVRQGFDAFINLCDGEPEEDIAGAEVAERLEAHGAVFTGADARCAAQCSSRRFLKETCAAHGIDTPPFVFLETLPTAPLPLRFPVFVKPTSGYASVGIEPDSMVAAPEALTPVCERVIARFGGALIEEFITGREFTVLVSEPAPGDSEPVVYTPMEVCFPRGESFKHFQLKWKDYDQIGLIPVEDTVLARRISALVQRYFLAMRGVGYFRLDLRMDASGRLYLVDCNAYPGIFYPEAAYGSADLILAAEPQGHRRFLEHLLKGAVHRRAAKRSQ